MKKSLFSLLFAVSVLAWIVASHADAFALSGKPDGAAPNRPANPAASAEPGRTALAQAAGCRRTASSAGDSASPARRPASPASCTKG